MVSLLPVEGCRLWLWIDGPVPVSSFAVPIGGWIWGGGGGAATLGCHHFLYGSGPA